MVTCFQGIFDGGNHTIRGLYVNDSASYAGLFGLVESAIIKNLILEESYVKGFSAVGGIVGLGYDNTLIKNCISNTTVIGTNSIGGIAGALYINSGIENCVNYGQIIGVRGKIMLDLDPTMIGGIVGLLIVDNNKISVINSVNYGAISGSDLNSAGGIAGYQSSGTIINNVNYGMISGRSQIRNNDGKRARVINNYTIGTVTGMEKYVGAVAGRNESDDGYVCKILSCRVSSL